MLYLIAFSVLCIIQALMQSVHKSNGRIDNIVSKRLKKEFVFSTVII
jgi:hypothetical protein